jgi:hypothetical protein
MAGAPDFFAASTLPRAGAVSVCAILPPATRNQEPIADRVVCALSMMWAGQSEQIAGERKNRTTSKHEAQRDQQYCESICKHHHCYQSSATVEQKPPVVVTGLRSDRELAFGY